MKCFAKGFGDLAADRDDCYKYKCSCHGNGTNDKTSHFPFLNVDKLEFAEQYRIKDKGKSCETFAYFMMYLSTLPAADSEGLNVVLWQTWNNVAPAYESVKGKFIDYAQKYMEISHEPITYYLISKKMG